jgi:hypothetical protein
VNVGFAEWVLSDDPSAAWLRSQAQIFIVPVMDGDRVATGDGGKQSIPHDHNEDWSATPHYPEVAEVEQRILTLARENRMALLVDIHDPGSTPRPECQLWVTPTNFLSPLKQQNQERFIQAANQELQGPMTMTKKLVWDGPGKDDYWQTAWHYLTCPWVYEHSNPQTVALTFEVPWNTPASTIPGYESVGQGLGRVIVRYLRETSPSGSLALSSRTPLQTPPNQGAK